MRYLFVRLLLSVFSFSCIHIVAQVPKEIDVPLRSNGSPKSIYGEISELSEELNLPDLAQSKNEFHFRFWSDRHVIEIWSNDTITFHGILMSFAREYNPMKWHDGSLWPHIKDYKPRFLFHSKMDLDNLCAKEIYNLLKQAKLIFIVKSEKLKGRYNQLDGECYDLEYANPQRYILKSYQMPIPSRKKNWRIRIKRVFQIMEKDLDLDGVFEDFKKSLPEGQYSYHGFGSFKVHNLKN